MRKARFAVVAPATLWIAFFLVTLSAQGRTVQERSTPILYFDVLELPARIDEPKLVKADDGYLLNCAVANRSGEQLLGLRLIFMILDREGKLRTRIAWNEESEIAAYSIKTFAFRPSMKFKTQDADRLFLAVAEVTGRETIWHVADAEKALRAYSRGQHDVFPKVQTVTNKVDSRPGLLAIPEEKY